MSSLPETARALILSSFEKPLKLETLSLQSPRHGTALVTILSTGIRPYFRQAFQGKGFFTFPLPYSPGNAAIARVLAAGPDSTALQPGQLVYVSGFVRSRDEPETTQVMLGLHDGGMKKTRKLFSAWPGLWRDVAAVPLEGCIVLDENILTNSMGYSFAELYYIERLCVAMGAIEAASLNPGSTVIVAPSTGPYSGAVAELAAQMGCRVLAVTRSAAKLEPLIRRHPRIRPVQLTGNRDDDVKKLLAECPLGNSGADALIDVSPAQATGSPEALLASMDAVRPDGRVVVLGAIGQVKINLASLMVRNITLKGQWMYTTAQALKLVRMIEAGVVKLGKEAGHEVVEGGWKFQDWEHALEVSEGVTEWGRQIVFVP